MNNIQNRYDEFERAALKEFQFLCDECGFKLSKNERDSQGIFITYVNKTTAIRISYESREGGIFILLSQLIDGQLPAYPIFIGSKTVLNSFHLEDVIQVKNPDIQFPRLKLSTPSEIDSVVRELGALLRKFAADILSGNFAIFPELDRVVKMRQKNLADQRNRRTL